MILHIPVLLWSFWNFKWKYEYVFLYDILLQINSDTEQNNRLWENLFTLTESQNNEQPRYWSKIWNTEGFESEFK